MTRDWLAGNAARLESIAAELSQWNERVDAEFRRRFDFNRARTHDFESELGEATAAARERAGPSPLADVYALFDDVCATYLDADEHERAAIRAAIASHEAFAPRTTWYIGRNRELLAGSGEERWLEWGVAAPSVTNCRPDYRDVFVALGDLYVTAHGVGFDAGPVFRRVAALSDTSVTVDFSGSTVRDFFAGFERSAFFAESVRPRLAAQR